MGKLDDLSKLASQMSLDDQSLLDAVFATELIDLFNWMPAYDMMLRMRGQKFADSMLFNLVKIETVKALDLEEIELSRSLHGIRAVLNSHPNINFAYARWLTTEDGVAVLKTLKQKGYTPKKGGYTEMLLPPQPDDDPADKSN